QPLSPPPGQAEPITLEQLMEREGVQVGLFGLISFKSGDAKGKYILKLMMTDPSGDKKEVGEIPIAFEGAEHGINIRVQFGIQLTREGLYWVDVIVDGKCFTRMPLRIAIQREPSPGLPQSG